MNPRRTLLETASDRELLALAKHGNTADMRRDAYLEVAQRALEAASQQCDNPADSGILAAAIDTLSDVRSELV